MRKAELTALTGIRFYAALAVFLSHVTVLPGMAALSGERLVFNAGVVGVSFFFVLSGFILTYNYAELFRGGVSTAGYKRFVWDRLTKVYPVHFLTLMLVLPMAMFSPNEPLDWRVLPFHVLLLQCFWPFAEPRFYYDLNVPSWSISCEWFFYLLAPAVIFCALGGLRRWAPVVLLLAYAGALGLVLSHSGPAQRLYSVSWFAPSRFVEFLAGVFLARAFLNPGLKLKVERFPTLSGWLQAAGVGLIVGGAVYRKFAPWPFWGGLLYVPGSTLLVLGLAYGHGPLAAHLSHSWLKLLGTASFSFYLVHAPILRAMRGVCNLRGWEVQSWMGFGAMALGMFVVVQTVALFVCRGYELPLQNRLRNLVRAGGILARAPGLSNQ